MDDPLELLDAVVAGFGGERRDGQRALARAVADAIRDGHHLVAEAPTGSGKSLAYLAPAVASGLRVVVATSTKALQSQLVEKDLPALREHRRRRLHLRAAERPVELPLPREAAHRRAARRAVRDAGRRGVRRAARSRCSGSPSARSRAIAPSSTTRSPTRRGRR